MFDDLLGNKKNKEDNRRNICPECEKELEVIYTIYGVTEKCKCGFKRHQGYGSGHYKIGGEK